ncbi:MAG: hypothetical protein ABJP48_09635 [Erythrobacter sp.]
MIEDEKLREEAMALFEQLSPEIASNIARYDRTGFSPAVLVVISIYPIHEEDRKTGDH